MINIIGIFMGTGLPGPGIPPIPTTAIEWDDTDLLLWDDSDDMEWDS